MAGARSLRVWTWLHTWSSLVCTLFVLLLCLTGLPLIFHHEIDQLTGDAVQLPALPQGAAAAAPASFDAVLRAARERHPQRVLQVAAVDEKNPLLWHITLAPTPASTDDVRSLAVDGRTAQVLRDAPANQGFMDWMRRLHVDLIADLAGQLFLGLMGLLLLIAIVSGLVLYAPFMRRLAFGTVRRDRSPRLKWLDLHNLLGISTLVWALVVGFTGVVNTWADPLVKHWQSARISALQAASPDQGRPPAPEGQRAPMQATLAAAQAHTPGLRLAFAAFPGTALSSPQHVTYFMRGDSPLTARLLRPVLVDARTAAVTASIELPWYLKVLMLAQPLHFGDYGGWPMKILWALLDLATVVVLGSGVYLWLRRRADQQQAAQARATEEEAAGP